MTRAQAIEIAKEVMMEQNRKSYQGGTELVLHEYMVALLIRLEILWVEDD